MHRRPHLLALGLLLPAAVGGCSVVREGLSGIPAPPPTPVITAVPPPPTPEPAPGPIGTPRPVRTDARDGAGEGDTSGRVAGTWVPLWGTGSSAEQARRCPACNVFAYAGFSRGRLRGEVAEYRTSVGSRDDAPTRYVIAVTESPPPGRDAPARWREYAWLLRDSVEVKLARCDIRRRGDRREGYGYLRAPAAPERAKGAALVVVCRVPDRAELEAMHVAGAALRPRPSPPPPRPVPVPVPTRSAARGEEH